MRHASPFVTGLFLSLLAACAPVEDGADEALDAVDEVASNPQNLAFVTLRPDTRRGVSPLCGGYWVRRLNRTTMRCVDGRYAGECYVGAVDWSGLNLSDEALADFQTLAAQGRAVLRGRIDPMRAPWSSTGELVVVGGWRPVTSTLTTAPVWTARDNGVRCITTPCFSVEAARVNVISSATDVSDVSLAGIAGLSRDDDARVRAALANADETVLLAGTVGAAGRGRALRATQAWLQVSAPVPEHAFCTDSAQCTPTVYHSDIARAADCYCRFCPSTATTTATADARERAYRRYCRASLASCPVPRCVQPRPVACVNHACTFQ